MKTLDEVIKTFECCYRHGEDPKCDECPYNFKTCGVEYALCGDVRYDALHYLKEYQLIGQALRDSMDDISKRRHEFEVYTKDWFTSHNPELTWEDLKQMEGKPVWIELIRDGRSAWGLSDGIYVDAFGHDMVTIKILHDLWHLDKAELGKTWRAYCKERYGRYRMR